MNASGHVLNVTAENFQEIIEQSKKIPVLLEFYADAAEPSQQLAPVLQKLVDEYKGKFILARVDVQANQAIAQQLGVRTLPTLKVISEGQMVHELEGPQEETSLRKMLDELTKSPVERIQAQIKVLLEENDRAGAITMLQQIVEQEPTNMALQTELADLLVMESRVDEAKKLLAALPLDAVGINKPQNRIEFIEKAATFDDLAVLSDRVAAKPDDLMARYQYAIRLVVDDQIEEALNELLEMLKLDKSFEEDLARKTMILIFELLGKGDPVSTAYRRKMFAFLH